MSLMSLSAYYAKKSPLQEQVTLNVVFVPFGDSSTIGYSKGYQYVLQNGANYAFILDFPSEFFNLANPNDRNNTPDAQMLFSHFTTMLKFDESLAESYEIKWFCDLSGFTVPDQLPGHCRVWFAYQDPTGAPVLPSGVFSTELTFGKAVPVRSVLPVPV